MLTLVWLRGLLLHRSGRLLGAALGVALTVALLTAIGAFVAGSASAMTQRAVASVPVDWQIQLAPGTDSRAAQAALEQATPYTALETVGYADAAGFAASTGGTVQTTGPGKVLGLGPQYRHLFPAELRPLIGSPDGVLVAQQTAANLRVTVGDRVTIQRPGLEPVVVTVDGVVDLPYADSLFQAVGVPAGVAPQAPPDNVLLLPASQWHQNFDPQAAVRPDTVRSQLHVRLARDLPVDPEAAYTLVQQRARNLEARLAGGGVVGDNLGARLDAVRADALYARVLFLFLGVPGGLLAGLLTLGVAASGWARRRREEGLLRLRGAATSAVLRLEGLEAVLVALGGLALGLALALVATRIVAPDSADAVTTAGRWVVGSALFGLALAVAAVLYPVWQQARASSVVAARVAVGRGKRPLWQQLYLDVIVLAVSALAFWQTASAGYQVVLAPEGVAQSSVAYQAFLAPVCLWLGAGLLVLRLWEGSLGQGKRVVGKLLRPVAGGLSAAVAGSLGRQRVLVARGVALVALAFAFATSTAVFNTTYNAQARVDAELTNGADVTVTGSAGAPPSSKLAELRALPGVANAQPLQHRFAYVGTDLQDLYGIDVAHLSEATSLSNAYFASGNAGATLAALAGRPDGVLVSAETARDYQLRPGDQLNLRLQSAKDHQYHVVPFHFVDIVREFPTAPKDSFLVANASYVSQQTGSDAAEIVLIRATAPSGEVAARVRAIMSALAGIHVTDIGSTQQAISSSLTSVDLHGLTKLELVFAVLLVAGATGLILALGLAERRRTFAILSALGASGQQLGAFLWSEALMMLVGGILLGVALGFGVAQMLVALLTGVFDPPPETLAVPWTYLAILMAAAVTATTVAVIGAQAASVHRELDTLREG